MIAKTGTKMASKWGAEGSPRASSWLSKWGPEKGLKLDATLGPANVIFCCYLQYFSKVGPSRKRSLLGPFLGSFLDQGPQVSNKWSSNGRIQIDIKTTRFGLHFGVLFGRLGPLSGAWPSPTSQPSPSGHPASSSAKPSQADGAAQPKPNQPSPAQTRQGQPAKQPSAVMATQAESMKSQ